MGGSPVIASTENGTNAVPWPTTFLQKCVVLGIRSVVLGQNWPKYLPKTAITVRCKTGFPIYQVIPELDRAKQPRLKVHYIANKTRPS